MPRVTITVPDKNSQPYRFALDRKKVTLGRSSDNDIVIDCPSVSVEHAVMERLDGGYRLRDLGSTNGTKLDGKARDQIELLDGLSVKLGDVDFDFKLTDEEHSVLRAERGGEDSPIVREEEVEVVKDRPAERARASRRRPEPAPPVRVAPPPSGGAGFLYALLMIVLTLGAFIAGMSIRYSQDTTRDSMLQDILHGLPAEDAEAMAEDETGE